MDSGMPILTSRRPSTWLSKSGTRSRPHNLVINNYNFGASECFSYLGAELTRENKVSDEIKERTVAGNKAYYDGLL